WPITAERIVRGQSDRAWFRPNPPLPKVTWSLRNNVNYQQSALLFGLEYVAENRQHFLEQFWTLGKRAVAKATTEGPAAWVFDGAQKRRGNLHNLLSLLQTHGVEVSVLDAPFEKLPAGSFVVRMDQPYSRLADAVLDTQYVRGEERVYDDTGWTLGYPYTYISTQDAARTPNLREKFDVILFPPTGTSNASTDIVNGLPPGPPLPWKKTPLTPNLGVDETDDMRPGLGMTGVANVQH